MAAHERILPPEFFKIFRGQLEKLGIDFFVVGAFARDIGLKDFPSKRMTEDIDIAIRLGDVAQFES